MPKVQKPTPGLAKFLGVETQGILRLEALESIQPVIEADDYLGPNQYVQLQDTAVIQNGSLSTTVPDKEFWRLKFVSMSCDTPAGVACNGIIQLTPAESGISYQLNPPFLAATSGAGADRFMFTDSEFAGYGVRVVGVNARPGDVIAARLVNETGAGNNTVRLFIQYQKLDL